MAHYDPATGKLRPTWKVSFSPWIVFVGSFIGGAVTGGVVVLNMLAGNPVTDDDSSTTVGQASILILGIAIAVFLILGPVLAWGLGFALRNVENNGLHILAFAALGLVVGYSIGEFLGRLTGVAGVGSVVAPAAGIGAAAGRWAISKYAQS